MTKFIVAAAAFFSLAYFDLLGVRTNVLPADKLTKSLFEAGISTAVFFLVDKFFSAK